MGTVSEQEKIKQLSPELQKLNEVRIDFERYCYVNLKIKTESGEIVPLKFNKIQKVIIKRVLDDLANNRPVRYIILKARKEGVSTLVEALIYWWTATHKNVKSKIVAHDQDTAEELYAMFRRYFENSSPLFKPTTKYNTRSDLTFDNDTGTGLKSQIDVASAKNTGTGRGQTIQCMHGCLHKDSLVILSDGSTKKIKDIEIGDLVFTNNGHIAPVSFKIMTGIKQTYSIRTWMSNEPIHASKDHKIMTIDGYKKVSELTSKDYIAKPKYKFCYMKNIKFSHITPNRKQGGGINSSREETIELDYGLGYLIGYYLAEGHIPKNLYRVTFTHHTNEHFVDNLIPYFKSTPQIKTIGDKTQTSFNDVFMCKFINHIAGRVNDKHVPVFGNKEFFSGIYEGYMDGDGSKTDPIRVRATSIIERIARNINRIGDILGRHGSLHYSCNRYRYGVLSKPAWTNSFCHGNNKPHIKKYKIVDGQVFVKIKSIDEYETAETYDLEIDHPDHNFETTIGVVSNSEVSKWQDGSELMAGLMQAVPKIPNTMIFLESTANGIGDFFHKTWQAAKAGNSVFKPLFFSWADREDYRLPVPENFKLTDEEKKLKIEHDLDDEQIAWRRETMKEFADDERKFYQEYPLTDIEAFLSSGNSRFNISALVKMDEKCYEPKSYEIIEKEEKGDKIQFGPIKKEFKLIEVIGAPLKIWKEPIASKKYVIGADVAEGIGGDFSVATIMDVDTTETVARWRGDAEPAEFGEILEQLGRYYNNALIACEINNHGLTTVQRIRDMHYPNLYRREKGVDERFEEFTSKLGWKTDRKTKPLMINALSEAIYTGQLQDYDHTFIRECMEYVVDDRGRTNAQLGAHDDTVISTAIALQVFDWTEIKIKSTQIPSRIPQKYAEIRKKHAGMMKTGAKVR